MNQPTLYLIPTPLGNSQTPCLLPHEQQLITTLTDFVVEAEKTARAHLKEFKLLTPIQKIQLHTLNEHTHPNDIPKLMTPLHQGRSLGILSEAGCPAIADPGAKLVALAHQAGYPVVPLVGPSSIILGLMASGANGQHFAFKGYLPSNKTERIATLKQYERHSRQTNETQIFIETPYRNDALLADSIATLELNTRLCIAVDLTLPTQLIISQTIEQWRRNKTLPSLKKRPCIFIIDAGN